MSEVDYSRTFVVEAGALVVTLRIDAEHTGFPVALETGDVARALSATLAGEAREVTARPAAERRPV